MKILPWNPAPIQPSRSEPSSSFISIPMSRKPPFRQFFWSIHLDQFFLQNQSDQSFLASLSKCFWIQQLQQWWCWEIGDAGCSQARNPPCKEILGGGSLGNLMGLPSQSSMRVNPPRFPYSSDHLAHLLITPDTDQIQTILVQLKTSLSRSKTLVVLRWLEMIIIFCMMIRQRCSTMGDHASDLMKTEQLGGDSWQRWKYSDADQDRSSGRRRWSSAGQRGRNDDLMWCLGYQAKSSYRNIRTSDI